jgi:hypothetical protein
MAELYLTGKPTDGKRMMIAPITSRKLARCPEPPDDTSGYFLTEEVVSDPLGVITILARIADEESALRIGRMFGMA